MDYTKPYDQIFNEKIDFFKDHKSYIWLRDQADRMLRNRSGFGWPTIAADDFIDRIVAMPLEYIQDWLDGKNELKWRRQDELLLNAIKGGFVELYQEYPDVEIHKVSANNASFYTEHLGFQVLQEKNGFCYVGKLDPTLTINSSILAHKIQFYEKYEDDEYKTTTLYFSAPKELLKGQYPEAESMMISVEFPTSLPEAKHASVLFSPAQHNQGYDWFDGDLSYSVIEKLFSLAHKAERAEKQSLDSQIHAASKDLRPETAGPVPSKSSDLQR